MKSKLKVNFPFHCYRAFLFLVGFFWLADTTLTVPPVSQNVSVGKKVEFTCGVTFPATDEPILTWLILPQTNDTSETTERNSTFKIQSLTFIASEENNNSVVECYITNGTTNINATTFIYRVYLYVQGKL